MEPSLAPLLGGGRGERVVKGRGVRVRRILPLPLGKISLAQRINLEAQLVDLGFKGPLSVGTQLSLQPQVAQLLGQTLDLLSELERLSFALFVESLVMPRLPNSILDLPLDDLIDPPAAYLPQGLRC